MRKRSSRQQLSSYWRQQLTHLILFVREWSSSLGAVQPSLWLCRNGAFMSLKTLKTNPKVMKYHPKKTQEPKYLQSLDLLQPSPGSLSSTSSTSSISSLLNQAGSSMLKPSSSWWPLIHWVLAWYWLATIRRRCGSAPSVFLEGQDFIWRR